MDTMIRPENFLNNFFSIYDETFENHHGVFLDKDTSLITTLETVSAQEASIPVGGKCASLAAQVAHVIFYLELMEKYFLKQEVGKVDWGEIWRTVEKVSPEEWETLKRDSGKRTRDWIHYSTIQKIGMMKILLVQQWQSSCTQPIILARSVRRCVR